MTPFHMAATKHGKPAGTSRLGKMLTFLNSQREAEIVRERCGKYKSRESQKDVCVTNIIKA